RRRRRVSPPGRIRAGLRAHRPRRGVLSVSRALVLVAALVGCTPGAAAPDASVDAGTRPLAVDHVEDLGAFSAPPTVVGRDGTTSARLGDRIAWTFGDTFLTKATPDDGTSVRSSTA